MPIILAGAAFEITVIAISGCIASGKCSVKQMVGTCDRKTETITRIWCICRHIPERAKTRRAKFNIATIMGYIVKTLAANNNIESESVLIATAGIDQQCEIDHFTQWRGRADCNCKWIAYIL